MNNFDFFLEILLILKDSNHKAENMKINGYIEKTTNSEEGSSVKIKKDSRGCRQTLPIIL